MTRYQKLPFYKRLLLKSYYRTYYFLWFLYKLCRWRFKKNTEDSRWFLFKLLWLISLGRGDDAMGNCYTLDEVIKELMETGSV